jgi:hypothetical protein
MAPRYHKEPPRPDKGSMIPSIPFGNKSTIQLQIITGTIRMHPMATSPSRQRLPSLQNTIFME